MTDALCDLVRALSGEQLERRPVPVLPKAAAVVGTELVGK
jgi:hypothetical protein